MMYLVRVTESKWETLIPTLSSIECQECIVLISIVWIVTLLSLSVCVYCACRGDQESYHHSVPPAVCVPEDMLHYHRCCLLCQVCADIAHTWYPALLNAALPRPSESWTSYSIAVSDHHSSRCLLTYRTPCVAVLRTRSGDMVSLHCTHMCISHDVICLSHDFNMFVTCSLAQVFFCISCLRWSTDGTVVNPAIMRSDLLLHILLTSAVVVPFTGVWQNKWLHLYDEGWIS